jgi:hypothetical protein
VIRLLELKKANNGINLVRKIIKNLMRKSIRTLHLIFL